MIISVTNLKGGVGKSTITQNLAVCFAHKGYKVCIVDTDTNQTSMKRSGFRGEHLPPVPVFGITDSDALGKSIKALNEDYEIVLIDGKPSLSKITSKILLVADLVLIPMIASGADFRAMEPFIDRYEQARELNETLQAVILCNRHDARVNLRKEVMEALGELHGEYGIPTFKTTINQRIAYEEAMLNGHGVYEGRDFKAKEEMVMLIRELEAMF